VKENRLLLTELEKKARDVLCQQGPLTHDTYKTYNKPVIKLLCKWKRVKIVVDKKKELFDLCLSNPEPPAPEPWTEEEESELQEMLKPDMPLKQTHLGVTAKQMAVATANNLEHVDKETNRKLLQSLATFERNQHDSS